MAQPLPNLRTTPKIRPRESISSPNPIANKKMSLRIAKKNPKATEIQVQGVGGITYSQLVAVAKALK